jgi:hypothetical protein
LNQKKHFRKKMCRLKKEDKTGIVAATSVLYISPALPFTNV